MGLLEDVRGLRQPSPPWEEYEPTRRASLPSVRPGHAPHPVAQKRERKRRQTLARRRPEAEAQQPPDPSKVRPTA